jgi:hypothetical protein
MPRDTQQRTVCPGCGSIFQDEIRVLRHMNHPSKSACRDWFLSCPRRPYLKPHQDPTINSDFELDITPESEGTLQSQASSDVQIPVEFFPLAGATYGPGTDFMSKFNADTHSEERKDNLWYPFASKGEWELAFWLSRSGLSMALIDSFLTLQLVHAILILFFEYL